MEPEKASPGCYLKREQHFCCGSGEPNKVTSVRL
jgi:hypothetical protein